MRILDAIRKSIGDRWTGVFLRILAVLLFMGAGSHLASISGAYGVPWISRPIQFQIADPVLLLFDLVVGLGLWRKRFWAVIAWISGVILLQFIPILFFWDAFATDAVQRRSLQGLLVSNALFLGVFAVLVLRKRKG